MRAPFLEYGGASSSLTASELQAYVPDLIVERVEAGQLDGLRALPAARPRHVRGVRCVGGAAGRPLRLGAPEAGVGLSQGDRAGPAGVREKQGLRSSRGAQAPVRGADVWARQACEIDDMARCHAAVNIVQEKVCRHGGTLTRVLTDDKGTRFLIAFGLPGHAHENDEQLAVLSSTSVPAG